MREVYVPHVILIKMDFWHSKLANSSPKLLFIQVNSKNFRPTYLHLFVTRNDPELEEMGNLVYFEIVALFPVPVDPMQMTHEGIFSSSSYFMLFFFEGIPND